MKIGSLDPRLEGIGPAAYVPWRLKGEFQDVDVSALPVRREQSQ